MPANLTPQYYEAEEAFKTATNVEDKIVALQEMMAVIPKHKGTEKLQADLKRRLSKLRDEQEQKRKSKTSSVDPFFIERQGAGQVVLFGFPNAGKSALISSLTRAKAKVGDYPFTTAIPLAGMMPFEEAFVQLVDTPPLTADGIVPGMMQTLRSADRYLVVIDAASGECLDQVEACLDFLTAKKLTKPYLLIANKLDHPEAPANVSVIRELRPKLDLHQISAERGHGLEELRRTIFLSLGVIRVFGKTPGKPAELTAPFYLKSGGTVLDLAHQIHREFRDRLKLARIWGSGKFEGQTVPRDYVLADKDIVELHLN
ncbi:MAG: GTPase [Eubacteriales bacterium]|nr:50S ribosome-binding GTPase [Bacillota bacterium]MBV1727075.1 50S ribosome-binding GTPase [Desulforudis sp.]MDP3050977.1 GTPase [Eubacteriales bacterium]MDQ7789396.1 GTPase [Clostridia bacterium]MBU4533129.1 50S ribosome-binding GTPase [Bacillota bacterium]